MLGWLLCRILFSIGLSLLLSMNMARAEVSPDWVRALRSMQELSRPQEQVKFAFDALKNINPSPPVDEQRDFLQAQLKIPDMYISAFEPDVAIVLLEEIEGSIYHRCLAAPRTDRPSS